MNNELQKREIPIPLYEDLPKIRFSELSEDLQAPLREDNRHAKYALVKMVSIVCFEQGVKPHEVQIPNVLDPHIKDCMEYYALGKSNLLIECRKVYHALGRPNLLPNPSIVYPVLHSRVVDWINGEAFRRQKRYGMYGACMRFLTWLSEEQYVGRKPNDIPVTYIQRRHLMDYRNHLLKSVRDGLRSSCTAKWHLQTVIRWLKWLSRERLIGPINLTGLTISASESRTRDVPSHTQLSTVIQKLMTMDVYEAYIIFFLLLLATGARPIEIRQLTKSDLDLERKRIRLQSKNGPERWIPLQPNICKVLETYLHDSTHVYSDSDPVLRGITGNELHESVIHEHFKKAQEQSGVKIDGQMALRHRFATECYETRVPPTIFQYLMGHKTLSEMKRYQHANHQFENRLIDESVCEWMEALE